MTGVLGKPYLARQDAALGIGRTQFLGVRWRRTTNADGSNPQVFDLSGYTGVLRITSESGELWLERPLTFDSTTGVVAAEFNPEHTDGPLWFSRSVGKWAMVVTSPEGNVTVLVAGVMRIIQEGLL